MSTKRVMMGDKSVRRYPLHNLRGKYFLFPLPVSLLRIEGSTLSITYGLLSFRVTSFMGSDKEREFVTTSPESLEKCVPSQIYVQPGSRELFPLNNGKTKRYKFKLFNEYY